MHPVFPKLTPFLSLAHPRNNNQSSLHIISLLFWTNKPINYRDIDWKVYTSFLMCMWDSRLDFLLHHSLESAKRKSGGKEVPRPKLNQAQEEGNFLRSETVMNLTLKYSFRTQWCLSWIFNERALKLMKFVFYCFELYWLEMRTSNGFFHLESAIVIASRNVLAIQIVVAIISSRSTPLGRSSRHQI